MSQNHRKSSFCFSNQPLPRRRREGRSVFTWSSSRPATIIPENYQTTVQIDNGATTHHYLWTPNQQDKLLADTTSTEVLWSLTDHLGTIRDILGVTATHLIYDAFGNLTSGTNPLLFGYTGKPFDNATKLQNNINRWYDATTGRWLSTDPIGFEGNDTNLYRYVNGKLLSQFDTNGLRGGVDWNAFNSKFGFVECIRDFVIVYCYSHCKCGYEKKIPKFFMLGTEDTSYFGFIITQKACDDFYKKVWEPNLHKQQPSPFRPNTEVA